MDQQSGAEAGPRRARLGIASWIGSVILILGALLQLSPATRLALRTVLLFPSFFASLPISSPGSAAGFLRTDVVELQPVDGYVRAHIYRISGGPRPALVISLGINPVPPDDPRVVRLMTGLARSGLVAVLVESEALNQDRLTPGLPAALTETIDYVSGRADVLPDRVGLFGFSVGGSLALDAAAGADMRGKLRLVEAFGGFADLQDAVLSVATHTFEDHGSVRLWEPDVAAQRHLANALIAGLGDPAEADQLRARFVGGDPGTTIDPAVLSREAVAIYRLLSTRDRAEGARWLTELPPAMREGFSALSPLPLLREIDAPLYVMYDADDPLLPFTGSRALCASARQEGKRPFCSGFSIFQHVDPTRVGNPVVVGHDLVELFMHVFALEQRLQ